MILFLISVNLSIIFLAKGGDDMKNIKVVFTEQIFDELRTSLRWDGKEKAVYLLCHSSVYDGQLKLLPYKICVPTDSDYVSRAAGHYEIDKPFINKVINNAIDTNSDFIQCHVHPSDPAIFSSFDERVEPNFMKHIADKVKGIHHASIVFGRSLDTVDGWFFDRNCEKVVPIDKVVVVGKRKLDVYLPYKSKLKNTKRGRFLDRTIKAFGAVAIRKLGLLDVGVVGVSAIGSPIIEFLARDSYRSILMCDPDIIEETNLNRLSGTTPGDIGKSKVKFYSDYVRGINPLINVEEFPDSFYQPNVQNAFSQVDILFGCVDSAARLSMNRLALADLIPYFDLGAGIVTDEGKPSFVGGQVYSVIPGRGACFSCSGVFDNLLPQFYSPEKRKREIAQGYLKDEDDVNPLVHFLDYTIAGIGYHEMLKYVWGTSDKEIYGVHYNGVTNDLKEVACSAGCINCQVSGLLGQGDKVDPMIPLANEPQQAVGGKRMEKQPIKVKARRRQ